jgi:hypothetical protein
MFTLNNIFSICDIDRTVNITVFNPFIFNVTGIRNCVVNKVQNMAAYIFELGTYIVVVIIIIIIIKMIFCL